MPLTADEKHIRLESIADRDWQESVSSRVNVLAPDLRTLAESVVHQGRRAGLDYHQHNDERRRDALALDALDPTQRLEILAALHPELAPDIENWWVAARSYPYQVGRQRRAFRSPDDHAATALQRFDALQALLLSAGPFRRNIVWLAAWGDAVLRNRGFTGLLSATIDRSAEHGDAVFDILCETVKGEHEIAVMHHSAVGALLQASRPAGWELIEGLLLAAQRQEGLRQTVLEQLDEGNHAAFAKLLQTIIDNDLFRFAATVRAVGVWFGLPLDVESVAQARTIVQSLIDVLTDQNAADAAIASGDPTRTYTALVALAIHDAPKTIDHIRGLLPDLTPPCRAAVVLLLSVTGISQGRDVLVEMLDDPELNVALAAFRQLAHLLQRPVREPKPDDVEAIDPLMRLVDRMPKSIMIDPVLVGGEPSEATRQQVIVTAMYHHLGELDLFLPYFDEMDTSARSTFATRCGRDRAISAEVRACLLRTVGGRGSNAAASAMQALERVSLEPGDAPGLEALLTRKATKLRQGVVSLLNSLDEPERLAAAERLWSTGNNDQRNAACELVADAETDLAVALRSAWGHEATDRQRELLGEVEADPTADELYDEAELTPAVRPTGIKKPTRLVSNAAAKLLDALDDLAEQYKDVEVEVSNWQGTITVLLADARHFPQLVRADEAVAGVGRDMLLGDIIRTWWDGRAKQYRDQDGCEAMRAQLALANWGVFTTAEARDKSVGVEAADLLGVSADTLRHRGVVGHWLSWLAEGSFTAKLLDQFVTASEYIVQEITAAELENIARQSHGARPAFALDPRHRVISSPWHSRIETALSDHPEFASDELIGRLWRLERWIQKPFPDAYTLGHYGYRWVLPAFEHEQSTAADVYDYLIEQQERLRTMTRRRRDEQQYPKVLPLVDRLRTAIVDAELARGELPALTSKIVHNISSIQGADLAMQLVGRLGSLSLSRGYTWGDDKQGTLSHLIRVNYPASDDSPTALSVAVEKHRIKEQRLIEFGVYAPQWAAIVEAVLGWSGFEEAVWWIHAHTKDDGWNVGPELRETWAAMSAERTPLSGSDLIDGAVDIEWFWRVHGELGGQRWKQVYAAGKYASSGAGHRRAQLFADALTGEVNEVDVIKRIVEKRHQDSVRGLGLVPLPKAEGPNRKARLARYQVLREFERGSRKFGSQRQASERAAMRIGLENLARNAGYRDPAHFSWAMEADELKDLANGPLTVTHDDVTVTLAVDDRGVAELSVARAGKALKQIPAKLRKVDEIVELREHKTQLTKQVSRVRSSLEVAMINQDSFSPDDLADLRRHPVVAPMLNTLVFVDRSGKCMRLDGDRFLSAANRTVKPSATGDGEIRIAHPVDLFASKAWSAWQARCFVDGIEQPFKQVFRELYVPTESELTGTPNSERYAGHQVQPSQAKALFGARAWHTHHDDHVVTKTFHREDLVARVELDGGFFSVADVELPVLHSLWFTRRTDHVAQPISGVPGIMFSEVMRDLDLVVSVAHAGGVDPEASQSTVEMRTALARETAAVMGLANVEFVGNHAVIAGKLGEYSLHLGSGIVHRRPGGQVCVVPVHAQRRGRIFLPFADDDPRTAEVLSKLLLFARDEQILDPTILSQLRG